MSAQMTKKERVLAAVRRHDVDYVPCSPFFNSQDWVQRFHRRYNFPFGPSRQESVRYGVEELGLDMVVGVGWRTFYPAKEVSARTWLDDDVLRKVWTTPAGELEAAVKYDPFWPHGRDIPFFTDYSIGRFVKPWLQSEQDLECLSHILLPPRSQEHLDEIEFAFRHATWLAGEYDLAVMFSGGSGLTGAQQLCDSEAICLMSVDNPQLLDAYAGLEHRLTMKHYEIALDLGVDIIRRNGFYESCDFFSPTFLQDVLGARLREEAGIVHQAGKVIGYTLLTGYTPLTEHLAATDLDCIITPDPFFRGEDPRKLHAALGERMSFWSGPSDTVHTPWDDQEAVRQAVRDTFEIFGKKGLLIAVCSSFKAPHPWANMLALVDEWKKLR
jgi:hypothetical protein